MTRGKNHISVCICSYKRPLLLEGLLIKLQSQRTEARFEYGLVVVDNDLRESARSVVERLRSASAHPLDYYVEPEQNIALARNKAVRNARGDFIAFIDDDECPESTWLLNLYTALARYAADGVLGPVNPYFEVPPPQWIVRGKIFDRPSHETGYVLSWYNCRTGNVLVRRSIFDGSGNMFNPEYGSGGEDRDFFRRMIAQGGKFVWCNEAAVHEKVPPERCRRSFLLRRALLRGKVSLTNPSRKAYLVGKSVIAAAVYTLSLPFLALAGQHVFMKYMIRNFDHIGRIMAFCGLCVVREKYIMKSIF